MAGALVRPMPSEQTGDGEEANAAREIPAVHLGGRELLAEEQDALTAGMHRGRDNGLGARALSSEHARRLRQKARAQDHGLGAVLIHIDEAVGRIPEEHSDIQRAAVEMLRHRVPREPERGPFRQDGLLAFERNRNRGDPALEVPPGRVIRRGVPRYHGRARLTVAGRRGSTATRVTGPKIFFATVSTWATCRRAARAGLLRVTSSPLDRARRSAGRSWDRKS